MINKLLENRISAFILSFIIATMLWFVATTEADPMTYKTFENIPIEYINAEHLEQNGLVVSNDVEETLSLRVYGRSMLIGRLRADDITATVDFSNITAVGSYNLEVNIEGISEDINIVEQSPKSINLYVDSIGERNINTPLLTTTGTIPEGYSVMSLTTGVEYVSLSGPSKTIGNVSAIVGKVDVSNKTEDFTTTVPLSAVNDKNTEMTGVEISPKEIEVKVKIGKTKTVNVNTVTTGNVKSGYKVSDITSSVDKVEIAGKEKDIAKINTLNTEPISIDNASSSIEKKVEFALPKGVVIVSNNKETTVNITIDKKGEKTINLSSFTFKGLNDNFNAKVNEDKVAIILEGDDNLLKEVSEENITGTIDVSGLTTGVYTKPVTISTQGLPSGVKIKSVNLKEVKVKISAKN